MEKVIELKSLYPQYYYEGVMARLVIKTINHLIFVPQYSG